MMLFFSEKNLFLVPIHKPLCIINLSKTLLNLHRAESLRAVTVVVLLPIPTVKKVTGLLQAWNSVTTTPLQTKYMYRFLQVMRQKFTRHSRVVMSSWMRQMPNSEVVSDAIVWKPWPKQMHHGLFEQNDKNCFCFFVVKGQHLCVKMNCNCGGEN